MSNRRFAAVLAAAALVALPVASASAHVTLQPEELPAGEFSRVEVRVPNERDDKGTTKVDVQFPEGFLSISHEPVPGWKVRVIKAKLTSRSRSSASRSTSGSTGWSSPPRRASRSSRASSGTSASRSSCRTSRRR